MLKKLQDLLFEEEEEEIEEEEEKAEEPAAYTQKVEIPVQQPEPKPVVMPADPVEEPAPQPEVKHAVQVPKTE